MTPMLKEIESLQQQAVRELHEEVHAERVARETREREWCAQVTRNCLLAIEWLADAGRAPMVSMNSLKEARVALAQAAQYSELLQDMEER